MEKPNYDIFAQALNQLSGGRVLDVATGHGGFIQILASRLKDYDSIHGIDIEKDYLAIAGDSIQLDNVYFIQTDASCMALADNSYDIVAISASLHHIPDARVVLTEMKRVLKPGGHFLLAEMHSDGITEAQRTFIALHHWAAQVDTAQGLPHKPTYSRQELCDFVGRLNLKDVVNFDLSLTDTNPWEQTRLEQIEGFFTQYLQRAKSTPITLNLQRKGERLKERVHKTGLHDEPIVIICGSKR